MNNKTKRYQKKLQNFIILRYPQPQKFSSLSLSLSPSTKYLASRNHRDSNAPSRDPPIRQRAKVSTVERVKDQNPPFKIIQFACLKGKAERERELAQTEPLPRPRTLNVGCWLPPMPI